MIKAAHRHAMAICREMLAGLRSGLSPHLTVRALARLRDDIMDGLDRVMHG